MKKRSDIIKLELEKVKFGSNFVDLQLPLNKTYFLKGDSGVGKSDFLKIIAGLKDPDSGHIKINGEDVRGMAFDEFLKYRLNIGYGFDMGGLLSNKSLFENLFLPLEYHGEISIESAQDKVLSYLRYFDLLELKDARPAMVSASIKKIICVLRAFINSPQLVILDDVTIGLTEVHFDKLTTWIEEYIKQNPSTTLVMAVQNNQFMKTIKYEEIWITKENKFKFNSQKRVA